MWFYLLCVFLILPGDFAIAKSAGMGARANFHSEASEYYNHAVDYQRIGKVDEAIANYSAALARNPKMEEAWCNLGIAWKTKDRLTEAEHCLQRSLTLSKDNSRNQFICSMNLAEVYEHTNQDVKAEKSYQVALLSGTKLLTDQPAELNLKAMFTDFIAGYSAFLNRHGKKREEEALQRLLPN